MLYCIKSLCIKIREPGLLLFSDERRPAIDVKHVIRVRKAHETKGEPCRRPAVVRNVWYFVMIPVNDPITHTYFGENYKK